MSTFRGEPHQDQIDALIVRLAAEPGFAEAMTAAGSAEDAVAVAANHGLTMSAGDITAAMSDGELSDADLEAVSGGVMTNKACYLSRTVASAMCAGPLDNRDRTLIPGRVSTGTRKECIAATSVWARSDSRIVTP